MECIICKKIVRDGDKSVIQRPRTQGLLSLLSSAEKRQDSLAKEILPKRTDILNGKIKIKYHVDCRKSYTSSQNIDQLLQSGSAACASNYYGTRFKLHSFNIRKMCLICNSTGTKKKKSLVSVQTGSGKATYQKIINAANDRNDLDMISKLSGYEDLFAFDAKYHKSCYSHYISKRNINSHKNKKTVPNISTNSPEHNSTLSTSSGSDVQEETLLLKEMSEIQILVRAAAIIRSAMTSFQPKSGFPTPDDINKNGFQNDVPNILLLFVSWLIDAKLFAEAEYGQTSELAAIPSNIILALFEKSHRKSSFHVGLGLHLYHHVPSRHILDTLSQLGLTCSYNEVRQITTSLAKQEINAKEEVYVPKCLAHVSAEKKNYIRASIDNFDLNEETIDGKGTTHAMAMVVFQEKQFIQPVREHIKGGKFALSNEEIDISLQRIKKYNKPKTRPVPSELKLPKMSRESSDSSKKISLFWRLLKFLQNEYSFLGWSDFQNIMSKNKIPISTITYLPFLNAPPTEFDTIFTAMLRLVELAEKLNQDHIVITADLAIYSKAREILWNNSPELAGKVTLQLGGMHLTMAFVASIGYIFADGGLTSILVETDIYAENSCRLMLDGKQYSRAIRSLTLAGDAMSRLFYKSLNNWYEQNKGQQFWTDELKQEMNRIIKKTIEEVGNLDDISQLLEDHNKIITEFVNLGYGSSKTFQYWYFFLETIDLLWRMLSAERNGDFESHLAAVSDVLPYLSAAGRNLYSKWLPVYLADIEALKQQVPHMYDFLASGNFVVKKTNKKRFNCVASDMALEQSINRDCKSRSGIIGFSRKPSALLRWMVTRHRLGEYSQNFIESMSRNELTQRKEGSSLQKTNETNVLAMINTIERDWCNPFDVDNVPVSLINICTGKEVNPDIELSLSNFINETENNPEIFWKKVDHLNFWKPKCRNKILTFKEGNVKEDTKKGKMIIGSELMFRRILCAAQINEIDLTTILSHELTLVPTSLFHDDGSMRKVTKSDLAKKIEDESKATIDGPTVQSLIVDGMVTIQELNEKEFITFNDLGRIFLKSVINAGRRCQALRTTVVFDTYNKNSIKSGERSRRGDNNVSHFNVIGSRKIQKYRCFLKSYKNKQSLLFFLAEYLTLNAAQYLNENETLIIAGGFNSSEKVVSLHKHHSEILKDLFSSQEEADTRMILHAIHETKFSKQILVKSVDTDVLILLIHFFCSDSDVSGTNVFMQLGHGSTRRFLSIKKVIQSLGTTVCSCLLALHCFTGCDTTSGFFKIGKKSAFEVLKKNIIVLQKLSELPMLSNDKALELATTLVLLLYKNKDKQIQKLNDLRVKLATSTNKPSSELPPTEGAFYQHFLRCMYQLRIWYSSNIPRPFINLDGSGWNLSEDVLSPIFSNDKPIPDIVRKSLSIYCSDKNCENRKCGCVKEGLKCCNECKCRSCNNVLKDFEIDTDENYELDSF